MSLLDDAANLYSSLTIPKTNTGNTVPVKSENFISPLPQGGIVDPNILDKGIMDSLGPIFANGAPAMTGSQQVNPTTSSVQPPPPTTPTPQQAVLGTSNMFRPQAQAASQPTPTPTPNYPANATDYEKQAAPIFDKYGVPKQMGMGIWAMEGRGKTINPNNPYNLKAYDSDPTQANNVPFKTPIEGTEEAAKFMAGQSKYNAPQYKQIFQQANAAYQKNKDPQAYLEAIAPHYSTNPMYTQTIIHTPEYRRWSN